MSERASKLKGLVWVFLAIVGATVFAFSLAAIARGVPWSVERWAGRLLGSLPDLAICDAEKNRDAYAQFQKVVQRLFPLYPEDSKIPLTFDVIAGDTVNAFAYLGARIYVFKGLIDKAESVEELAGVLAHEIEHVKRRHIIQGVLTRMVTLRSLEIVNMSFTRAQEGEADRGGLQRLVDAQVSVRGFQDFFERMSHQGAPPTILSDHPGNHERVESAKAYAGKPSRPLLSREEWVQLKKVCQ